MFDGWAARGRAEGMERGHGRTAAPALEALRLGPGDRLLDVGTGNGWACRRALSAGAEAVGIDLSAGMLRRAASGVAAVRADAQRLPLPDASFTAAWSMEAIYYAPDPDAALREVHRVLRPGAPFHMLIDHYAENEASHGWPVDTGLDMVLRGEGQWAHAFGAAGFKDVGTARLRAVGPGAAAWQRDEGTLHVTGRA